MLDFSGHDQKAKQIAMHYAQQFNNAFIIELLEKNSPIHNNEQAKKLGEFYWAMLDQSAEDQENNKVVLEETNLHHWMERLLNIIGGYLCKTGYEKVWNQVCDDA